MEANRNKNSGALKISKDWNQNSEPTNEKFSHITESNLKLEQDKEEQWEKNNKMRLHIQWEEIISSIKKLQPVKD